MACFFCRISNAKQCGGSCGNCGDQCPGVVAETKPDGLPNGMSEEDYTP